MKTIRPVVLAFTVMALACGATAQAQSRITKTLSLSPGGEFILNTCQGTVTVSGSHANGVRLVLTSNRNQLNKLFQITYLVSPSLVQINVRRRGWPSWFNSTNLRFDLKVPVRTRLEIRTNGGSVHTYGLEGDENLATSGGSIEVADVNGRVMAHTSGGSIRAQEVTGNAQLETSGGSIEVNALEGSLIAHTSGGPIRIYGVSGRVDATTSGGSIQATLAPGNAAGGVLQTSGGSIQVALDRTTNLQVDASTSGGTVFTDLPFHGEREKSRSRLRGSLGSGGALLRLHTSGGSIRITARQASE